MCKEIYIIVIKWLMELDVEMFVNNYLLNILCVVIERKFVYLK